MSVLVHSSRFEQEAISPHHTAQQFKISSAWALFVGSLALGIVGFFWFVLDVGFSLEAMSDALWGDLTLEGRWSASFGSVFLLIHSAGGIIFLLGAIEIWCSPYRLIFDGNGQLIILSLPGHKRIAVEDIQTVELKQKDDETVPSGIRLQHADGEVILPLFKGHEKFVNKLKNVYPAIEIINKNSPAPPSPEVET